MHLFGTRRVGVILGERGIGGDLRRGNLEVGGGDFEVAGGGVVQRQRIYTHVTRSEGLTQGLAQQQTS